MHVRVRTASDHNSAKSPSRQRASSSNSRVRSRVLGWVLERDWIWSLNSKQLRCEIPRLKVTRSFNEGYECCWRSADHSERLGIER